MNFFGFTTIIGFIAGVLTLAAFGFYIVSILKNLSKPKRSTWWIWTLNSFLLLTSYKTLGAKDTVWLSVAYAVGCIIIALLSIKFGDSGWSRVDYVCLAGAVTSVIFWVVIGPLATFITNLVIDFFGVVPTIYESFLHPEKEEKLPWIIWLLGGLLSLLVTENLFVWQQWSFETLTIAAYPLQITITDSLIVWFLIKSKNKYSLHHE